MYACMCMYVCVCMGGVLVNVSERAKIAAI